MLETFLNGCDKNFITISGGADPLWKYNQNFSSYNYLDDFIRQKGFTPRVITRELKYIEQIDTEQVSISLDHEVMKELPIFINKWSGKDIEFSVVMPPYPPDGLKQLFPYYKDLRKRLGRRLILREDLHSIWPLEFTSFFEFAREHTDIYLVTSDLCASGNYFMNERSVTGYELFPNAKAVWNYLVHHMDVYIFGGALKHFLHPEVHPVISDIDIIVSDFKALDGLVLFGYEFTQVKTDMEYPVYWTGKHKGMGLPIHAVVMDDDDVYEYIGSNQYDVDRIFMHNNKVWCDVMSDVPTIVKNIGAKIATRQPRNGPGRLFHKNRAYVEAKHKAKLLNKGWTING
jgi:hypothetical protein